MEVAAKILNGLTICKPQKKFLLTLFTAILTAHGKINFRNLSRYSDVSEKTYSRQYAKSFAFAGFNREVIEVGLAGGSERIVVIDASFVQKSGKATYGLDYFWNGCHRRSEKGLEVSSIAIVDVSRNTGFTLSVRQSEPIDDGPKVSGSKAKTKVGKKKTAAKKRKKKKCTTKSEKKKNKKTQEEETLVDQYLAHLKAVAPSLLDCEKYVVGDGYFSKQKFVDGVCDLNLHQIGKLRCDANMRFLYTGPKRAHGSGRQKVYDGKVNWQDLSRFDFLGTQDGIAIYSLVLNHVSLKRNVKVVVLVQETEDNKKKYALLFSTDTDLRAQTIVRYYKARFQIEFLFRDAKQFTGLCDCQARDKHRLDFHFNASLTTLNLAKLEHMQTYSDSDATPFSMASIKACYFNDYFLQHIFSMFDLDPNLIKKSSHYLNLRNYGKIAA